MKRLTIISGLTVAAALVAVGAWLSSRPEQAGQQKTALRQTIGNDATAAHKDAAPLTATAPAVTAIKVRERDFVETVLVTGSLVARDEIVVAPEVEGLRIVELRADEGDRVQAGDVLARLQDEALQHQLDQRRAALKRAQASLEQARSQIKEAKAREEEALAALERAKPLRRQKIIAESVIDQRRATAISASAQVSATEEGLRVAEAGISETEAQIRELEWRLSRTEIKAPVSGLISKRNARIGEIAIGANAFTDLPMFRIIADNEIELEAEVPEADIAKVEAGQQASATVTGVGDVEGKVRLVSPEINKQTRLGQVRIFLGDDQRLKLGSFARATIKTRRSRGLAIPLSAIAYGADGTRVLVVKNGKVSSEPIVTGLLDNGVIEVRRGLAAGDIVVAKAATFLRDGDEVNAVLPEPKISEAR